MFFLEIISVQNGLFLLKLNIFESKSFHESKFNVEVRYPEKNMAFVAYLPFVGYEVFRTMRTFRYFFVQKWKK